MSNRDSLDPKVYRRSAPDPADIPLSPEVYQHTLRLHRRKCLLGTFARSTCPCGQAFAVLCTCGEVLLVGCYPGPICEHATWLLEGEG